MTGIVFTPFPHEAMVEGVHAIAAAMEAGDWRPSLLVGIGRGGLAPAVFLSHRMGVPLVPIGYSTRIAQFGPDLVATLAGRTRAGERLLFVDDINDSGKTIGEIRAGLAAADAMAGHVRFAVLLDNIRSGQTVDYRFRTIDRATQKDWFVFPWEAMAPRETLSREAMEVPERLA